MTSGEQSTKFYKGEREAPPRITPYHVSPGGQECEGISHHSFSVCNAVLTNHNYGETAVNGYLLTKQPIEVGSISTYLDPLYTGPDKFLNG